MQSAIQTLELGAAAPVFDLPATDGHTYSLASFQDTPLLVIIFLANHCPYVSAWEDRIIAIGREFGQRDVAFAAISSNDAMAYPRDSFEEMRKRAEEKGYPFSYLYDEDQSVARAFGATRTPEVFVFDQERRLRYHGAVDSDYEESAGVQHYLRDALDRLVTAQEVFVAETRPVGCSMKWKR